MESLSDPRPLAISGLNAQIQTMRLLPLTVDRGTLFGTIHIAPGASLRVDSPLMTIKKKERPDVANRQQAVERKKNCCRLGTRWCEHRCCVRGHLRVRVYGIRR